HTLSIAAPDDLGNSTHLTAPACARDPRMANDRGATPPHSSSRLCRRSGPPWAGRICPKGSRSASSPVSIVAHSLRWGRLRGANDPMCDALSEQERESVGVEPPYERANAEWRPLRGN